MGNKFDDLPDVLSVEDIRRFLRIGRVQAYELVNSGRFKVFRTNRRIFILKREFINCIEGGSDM